MRSLALVCLAASWCGCALPTNGAPSSSRDASRPMGSCRLATKPSIATSRMTGRVEARPRPARTVDDKLLTSMEVQAGVGRRDPAPKDWLVVDMVPETDGVANHAYRLHDTQVVEFGLGWKVGERERSIEGRHAGRG